MITKSVHENELIYGMHRELQSQDLKQGINDLPRAVGFLQAAMEIFEEAGLTAQSDKILAVLSKIAENEADQQDARGKPHRPRNPAKISDPHTKGLTPNKMVENYKHYGIPFNMTDDGKAEDMLDADINEAELEVEDPHADKDFEEEP
jgi:hypothetical protein